MGPRPRYVSLVPTQLRRLLTEPQPALAALQTFDAVLVGGAALEPQLARRALDEGIRVVTTYGMAESCGGCVYDGIPLDGVEVVLVDGVIRLGGATIALGYAGQEGGAHGTEDGDRFSYRDAVRWFTTSDIGELDAGGWLTVTGRADNAITTGGLTVHPETLEAALRLLDPVRDALVVGLPDPEWGQAVTALLVGAPRTATLPDDAPHDPQHATLVGLRDALGNLPNASKPVWAAWVGAVPELAPGKPDRAQGARLAGALQREGKLVKLR
jgi:O-succinylbenzoic acid--CoA ligase